MNADRAPNRFAANGDRNSVEPLRSSAFPKFLACLVVAASALNVEAAVTATDAWVRGTVPAQQSTGAFVTLKSSDPVKVIKVQSPAAKSAGIHATETTAA
jgi:copper(I)-binding protein